MKELSLQLLSQFDWVHYVPTPDRFFKSAGSIVAAAAFGAGYGLAGRIVYPNAGIVPLHYAIWFTVAFQIKYTINLVANQFTEFMSRGAPIDEWENVSEDDLTWREQIRSRYWKLVCLKDTSLKNMDEVLSRLFNIRPYQEVKGDNVYDASFVEMCRYRVWGVFKSTIVDSVSWALAYRLTNSMGFSLPSWTAVPHLIILRSIVQDILLIPSLHMYARFCNDLADELGDSDQRTAKFRAEWLRKLLPAL